MLPGRGSRAAWVALAHPPVQVAVALIANAALIRSIPVRDLKQWYVLVGLLPLRSVLELGLPQIALADFAAGGSRRCLAAFAFRSSAAIAALQAAAAVPICALSDRPATAALFAFGAMLRSLGNVWIAIAYARDWIVAERCYRIAATTGLSCAIVAAWVVGGLTSASVLPILWVAASAISLVLALLVAGRSLSTMPDGAPPPEVVAFAARVRRGLSVTAMNVPSLFIYNCSISYLAAFGSAKDVVLYGFFTQVTSAVNVINAIAPTLVGPRLARAFSTQDGHLGFATRTLVVNRAISLGMAAGAVGFLTPVVRALIGSAVSAADEDWLTIALVAFICVETTQVTMTAMGMAIGVYRFWAQSLASALIVLGLAALLVPRLGYPGLIAATLAAQLVTCLPFNVLASARALGLDLAFPFKQIGIVAAWGAALSIAFWSVRHTLQTRAAPIAVSIGCAALTLAALWWHRTQIRSFVASLEVPLDDR